MKIAFVTDDGNTITKHFGRAGKYLVIGVEDGHEISSELRDKLGHTHFHKQDEDHNYSKDHTSQANHSKHVQMIATIEDCDIVICGGMGRGAYQSINSLGKQVFMTDMDNIQDALQGYLAGDLTNMSDLVH
jgi:predicted Fe-Mo cluster-binding NifX family protein